MSFQVLLDENIPRALATALRRHVPNLRVQRVGEDGGLPIGASDGEVLRFAEAERALLVTRDRRTMPAEIGAHLARGGGTYGVLLLRRRAPLGAVVADIQLIVEATDSNEWRNILAYLPWSQ